MDALVGEWEDMLDISDPSDKVLEHAGVTFIKRLAMKHHVGVTELRFLGLNEEGAGEWFIKSYLPLRQTKESHFIANGRNFTHDDSVDTCVWNVAVFWHDGVLIQRREGERGVMYDARCVFDAHPSLDVEGPVMLFNFTMIEDGITYVARRWLRRIKK
eukprot:GHVO01070433.1.p1 GENE.GHVO01070433.1~~GHVO01070433.1.p1  ORF type:complete len:158 (+),score=25.37 GHVO01070433.1:67-540(+)